MSGKPKVGNKKGRLNRFAVGDTCREKFEKIIDDVAAFEQLEAGGGNMPLSLTIEARAIGPFDPWLPDV